MPRITPPALINSYVGLFKGYIHRRYNDYYILHYLSDFIPSILILLSIIENRKIRNISFLNFDNDKEKNECKSESIRKYIKRYGLSETEFNELMFRDIYDILIERNPKMIIDLINLLFIDCVYISDIRLYYANRFIKDELTRNDYGDDIVKFYIENYKNIYETFVGDKYIEISETLFPLVVGEYCIVLTIEFKSVYDKYKYKKFVILSERNFNLVVYMFYTR